MKKDYQQFYIAFLSLFFFSATISSHALGAEYEAVVLHPSGFTSTYAYGVDGTQQVGYGDNHALLWNGSANSFVDLHQFLPAGFSSSYSVSIDDFGNIVGLAYESVTPFAEPHAILWKPIPEPATVLLLGLGRLLVRRCRK